MSRTHPLNLNDANLCIGSDVCLRGIADSSTEGSNGGGYGRAQAGDKTAKAPKIFYATRTHSQIAQVQSQRHVAAVASSQLHDREVRDWPVQGARFETGSSCRDEMQADPATTPVCRLIRACS